MNSGQVQTTATGRELGTGARCTCRRATALFAVRRVLSRNCVGCRKPIALCPCAPLPDPSKGTVRMSAETLMDES